MLSAEMSVNIKKPQIFPWSFNAAVMQYIWINLIEKEEETKNYITLLQMSKGLDLRDRKILLKIK